MHFPDLLAFISDDERNSGAPEQLAMLRLSDDSSQTNPVLVRLCLDKKPLAMSNVARMGKDENVLWRIRMKAVGRQALAVLLAGALVGLPVFATTPRNLVGIAQGAGSIQINGEPFGGHASLFSGDSIVTGAGAPLTVLSSPAERFRVEPNTSALVTKKERSTLIQLEEGAVEFQTEGATSAELPDGVAIRPTVGVSTVAMVNHLPNGNTDVTVYKGNLKVATADNVMTVTAGHSALIRHASNAQSTDQNSNNRKKKVWAIFITTGLSAGAVGAVLANEQSNPVSAIDP